jgi:hypothetical protein
MRVVIVLHQSVREVSALENLPKLPDACCLHAARCLLCELQFQLIL